MKLLLLMLLLPASLTAMELTPYTAHYSASFSGLRGEMTMALSDSGEGHYVLESRTLARGLARLARPRDMVDRSEFTLDAGQLRPVSFVAEDGTRRNKRGNTIDFDWNNQSAVTEYRGETRAIGLTDGLLDRQLLQIAMTNDLANGVTEKNYNVVDRLDKKVYRIQVTGEERVEVEAGSFNTVRVERQRPGSSRASVLWCAPELNYLPVKMEQLKDGKVIGTLELTAYE
ncbi:MAG: DUF3108 domain-containing protein [Gammaproteobacteria bacterium]|nr:DUF3108 domain-containing protein [Gammaproteobacteria bacterium]NNF60254.1 DUF3108 domain-containing protein [Gammaproteobacteria bacterium]